jgi:protein phosphatase
VATAACVEHTPDLDGWGCTRVGAAIGRDGIDWVSVGDSPMFLIRRGEVFLLNEDHSLAPEIDKLAAAGKMSWEDAQADPRRHFLRSALTGSDLDLVDRSRLALEPGDVVLIASDGIQTLSRHNILEVVEANAAGGPDAIADALLAAVDAAGDIYQDNTTVVVVSLAAD